MTRARSSPAPRQVAAAPPLRLYERRPCAGADDQCAVAWPDAPAGAHLRLYERRSPPAADDFPRSRLLCLSLVLPALPPLKVAPGGRPGRRRVCYQQVREPPQLRRRRHWQATSRGQDTPHRRRAPARAAEVSPPRFLASPRCQSLTPGAPRTRCARKAYHAAPTRSVACVPRHALSVGLLRCVLLFSWRRHEQR